MAAMPVGTCSAIWAGPLPSTTQATDGAGWSDPAGRRTRRRRGSPPPSPGRPRTGARWARPAATARCWPSWWSWWRRPPAPSSSWSSVLARRGRRRGARAAGRQHQWRRQRSRPIPIAAADQGSRALPPVWRATGGRYGAPMATTRDITYEADGRTMIGTLALPDDGGGAGDQRPGVLVCHEGPGLDDHARERATRIADELGYVAFALDYHGDGKPITDRDQMMGRIGELRSDPPRTYAVGTAGLDILRAEPRTDAARLAAIGFCFGGTLSLELARGGADLKAVVGFHSGLSTVHPEDARNITGKVLALHRGRRPHGAHRGAPGLRGGDARRRRRLGDERLRRRRALLHQQGWPRRTRSPASPTTRRRTAGPGRPWSTCSTRSSERRPARRTADPSHLTPRQVRATLDAHA